MYVIFSAGIYIEEKSIYVPIITGLGALVNVVVNFVLIPVLNITGAALATLASYLVMAAGYYYVTQKFYKVKYELKRIGHIFLSVFIIGILYYFLYSAGYMALLYKFLLLVLFSLYIYFVAVNRKEIKLIRTRFVESRRKKN
jgi:O-antigen/teichoic acid export membrane protein